MASFSVLSSAKESYAFFALLSYSRKYWRKAVARQTQCEAAQRLISVMKANPNKARKKKGAEPSESSEGSRQQDNESGEGDDCIFVSQHDGQVGFYALLVSSRNTA